MNLIVGWHFNVSLVICNPQRMEDEDRTEALGGQGCGRVSL